ncbi:MAG: VacJ family lipoprotein [Gammaproteobacteria bacterium]|nr:VacJ family lipoprotein [Gammaproteobacteria bacterium]
MQTGRIHAATVALIVSVLGSGCASTAPKSADPTDSLEGMNRSFYSFNDSLDKNFFEPIARGYVKVAPTPVRGSVTKFFENVNYLNIITNDLLQGKGGQFASDTGRFLVNSTMGIGGLFDPATSLGMPEHDEDTGQTLGTWGANEGTYLVLPLMGPSSVRDLPDAATSMLLNPLTYLNAIVTLPLGVLNAINTRANLLEASSIRDQAALDPYTFVREAYRQQREYKIYDGNPPGDGFEDYVEGDADAAILKIY